MRSRLAAGDVRDVDAGGPRSQGAPACCGCRASGERQRLPHEVALLRGRPDRLVYVGALVPGAQLLAAEVGEAMAVRDDGEPSYECAAAVPREAVMLPA